jgi:Mg-chelatase subunit ChlD
VSEALTRWRLVLGESAQDALGEAGALGAEDLARDAALSWLYERDSSLDERDIRRSADLSRSALSVPDWVNQIHTLFPKETIERLERDAVEEYGLHELVTRREVLERVQPSETLLRAVLLTRHLMDPDVLRIARELVRKVVAQLLEKLSMEVRRAFSGSRLRRRSRTGRAADFDARATLRQNLSRFDPNTRRLAIAEPLFHSRARRHGERWQFILLVDQSGSMVGSVIHSAVTASCLWRLPSVKTHLVAFDTSVVDLSQQVADPVETLLQVQLGGGTDIAQAVRYAEGLVENPRRTVVALVSDLYEGGDADNLVRTVKRLCDQGSRFLALAALDEEAQPDFDQKLGRRLAGAGAQVGAMTPLQLVGFLKEVLG